MTAQIYTVSDYSTSLNFLL